MTKKEIQNKQKELIKSVTPLFQKFVADDKVESKHHHIEKYDDFYREVTLFNGPCFIATLRITREWSRGDSSWANDEIEIELTWGDSAEYLTYKSDYFAKMSNESIVERIKVMFKTADSMIKSTRNLSRY